MVISSFPRQWLTYTKPEEPFPFYIECCRIAPSEFAVVVHWCRDTFGAGRYGSDPDPTGAIWLADLWAQSSAPSAHTVTRFRFLRDLDPTVFALAWTGEITPI